MPNLFESVDVGHPGKSVFNLSHDKLFDCDMGELIPVLVEDAIPGDVWKIANEIVVRMTPLVAPILTEVNIFVHYFFVPNRILWPVSDTNHPGGWQKFITGGKDGTDASVLPKYVYPNTVTRTTEHTLWDYLGYPMVDINTASCPVDFPRRAYLKIWDTFYRDETIDDPMCPDDDTWWADNVGNDVDYDKILRARYRKDYFTSCLLTRQRGLSPMIPFSGSGDVVFHDPTAPGYDATLVSVGAPNTTDVHLDGPIPTAAIHGGVDFTSAGVDINDLRYAVQLQRQLERLNRVGYRYKEYLLGVFGNSFRDERLQLPEYIGGTQANLIISEVVQTSQSGTTPQGNLAGHGISISSQFGGSYRVPEHGVIMGIMVIKPKAVYSQGLDRMWKKESRYDYYAPVWANLSEQLVTVGELFGDSTPANMDAPFGYQGAWDEYRYRPSTVCGAMRSTYSHWHMSRVFATAPSLDSTFLECNPRKDCFADDEDKGFIVHFGNKLSVARPMPLIAVPGKLDHIYGG